MAECGQVADVLRRRHEGLDSELERSVYFRVVAIKSCTQALFRSLTGPTIAEPDARRA
jgi:hypothetical protein